MSANTAAKTACPKPQKRMIHLVAWVGQSPSWLDRSRLRRATPLAPACIGCNADFSYCAIEEHGGTVAALVHSHSALGSEPVAAPQADTRVIDTEADLDATAERIAFARPS